MFKAETYIIYKLYSVDGELLYIGKTNDFKRRLKEHLFTKSWANKIFSYKICNCSSATEMDIYEIYYIAKENPLYNEDCSHTEETFSEELKPLQFEDGFIIDYLGTISKNIKTPMDRFIKRKNNSIDKYPF